MTPFDIVAKEKRVTLLFNELAPSRPFQPCHFHVSLSHYGEENDDGLKWIGYNELVLQHAMQSDTCQAMMLQ
jgi:hypothetical protein